MSREFIEETAAKLQELNGRCLPAEQILIVYLDGMAYGEHHVLGAVGGVIKKGFKHALGMRLGSSVNAVVAKDLLADRLDPASHATVCDRWFKGVAESGQGSVW